MQILSTVPATLENVRHKTMELGRSESALRIFNEAQHVLVHLHSAIGGEGDWKMKAGAPGQQSNFNLMAMMSKQPTRDAHSTLTTVTIMASMGIGISGSPFTTGKSGRSLWPR